MLKTCRKCGQEKTLDLFYRGFTCKKCHSLYISRYLKERPAATLRNRQYQTRNADLIYNLKKDKPCKDCGRTFHPVAMDFDHLPGQEKKFNLSKALWHSTEEVLAEVAKCDLVCACCHRIRTFERVGRLGAAPSLPI